MLTVTKPRSQSPRASHTAPQLPPISFPSPSDFHSTRPSSQSTIVCSSPTTSGAKGLSITNTMHWLSRSSTQSSSSSPYTPSKPTRISEPKMIRSIELLSQPRNGVLGAGATVVRTPDEALRETGVRLTFDGKADNGRFPTKPSTPSLTDSAPDQEPLSPPNSPPLPPLPLPMEEVEQPLDVPETPRVPSRPTRSPPAVPDSPSLRSSLKMRRSESRESQNVPPLPANIPITPSPPPFKAILMSELPSNMDDPSSIIVTLETCTITYRTTLATVNSRPSRLVSYISSLFPNVRRDSAASSVYSTASDDMAAYRFHLTSQGVLPKASSNIHLFLDRPSAPYVHVLNYLRMPPGDLDSPEMLPLALRRHSSSQARLDALIELRDEAAYLGLDNLHKLCMEEIRSRTGPRMHVRGNSSVSTNSGSVHSLHASVYSLHTLMERVESSLRPTDSDFEPNVCSKSAPVDMPASNPPRSPPTPVSWEETGRSRSPGRHNISTSPPAGWI